MHGVSVAQVASGGWIALCVGRLQARRLRYTSKISNKDFFLQSHSCLSNN